MAETVTLTIEGRKVNVDASFRNLPPDQQAATVEEIARSMGIQPGAAEKTGFLPQVNRGIAESVGGFADFVNPFDSDEFGFTTGSAREGVARGMGAAGIRVAEGDPQTTGQAFARGLGEAAGSLVPIATGLQQLQRAGGAVGKFAEDALRVLGSFGGVAAEGAAGGISGAAEFEAAEAGQPEWVQGLAAVGAPVAAGMALGGVTAGGRSLAQVSPAAALGRRLAREAAPYTKAGANEVARNRIQTLAGGPERSRELAQRITRDNAFNLTPAQQTGDENMLALEQLAMAQNPSARDRIEARMTGALQQGRNEIAGMGGDVQAGQQVFAQQRDAFKRDLRQRAEDALGRADEGLAGTRPQRTETENSLQAMERVNAALAASLQEEKRLWDAVPRGAQVETTRTMQKAQEIAQTTPRAQANDIPRVVRSLLLSEDGFGDAETVAEMHGLYSELRRVARSAMAGNDQNKNMARIANDLADAILDDLGANAGLGDIGRSIDTARAYSSALHETFDRGAVGRLMKRTLDGDTAIDPELAMRRTVGRQGAEAAVTSRQIETAAPDTSPFIKDYIKDRFQKAAVTATGEFNRASARKFIRDNAELFDRYPELRQDLTEAVEAREGADAFAQRITQRIAALEDAKRSTGAAFVNAPSDQAFRAIFDATNPVQAARRLVNEARRDETGAALGAVKGALSDFLIKRAGREGGTLSGRALGETLSDPRTLAAMRQVYDAEEITRLRRIAAELAKVEQAQVAAPSIGSSLSGATTNRIIETVARVAAAQQGGSLGGGSMGGSLQTANIASANVRRILGNLTADRASALIADAVEDPELFRALLLDGQSVGALEKRLLPRLLPYVVGGVSAEMTE